VRMPDDMSPAEQARAARWAANWLGDHGYDSHRLSGGDAVAALRWAVDELDPPETVESLRAERDEAWRTRLRAVEKLCQAYDDMEEANVTIARLRATHTEAEAARGRCKRQPRVWDKGDPEPKGVQRISDFDGGVWRKTADGLWGGGPLYSWAGLLYNQGTLTEVLDED